MKKVIRLNESDLERLVKKIIIESDKEVLLNEININDTVKKLKAKGKVEPHEEEKLLDYISKKINGNVSGSSIVGDNYKMTITNKGFNVVKGSDKKRMFNFDQIGSMTKYINESKINEVGGYDSPDIMGRHAGYVMGNIRSSITAFSIALEALARNLTRGDIDKNEILGELDSLLDSLSELTLMLREVLSDFTEDDIILAGDVLRRKLSSFERRVRSLKGMGFDYTKDQLIEEVNKALRLLVPDLNDFIQSIITVDKRFTQRLQGKHRGWY